MRQDNVQPSEDFWIQVVEDSVHEGEPVIYVPLAALPGYMAVKLATKLDITVFVKGNNYLFSTDPKLTQTLLKEEDTLH